MNHIIQIQHLYVLLREKFKNMKCSGSKIVVLGDMKELGEKSKAFHLNMKPLLKF